MSTLRPGRLILAVPWRSMAKAFVVVVAIILVARLVLLVFSLAQQSGPLGLGSTGGGGGGGGGGGRSHSARRPY